MKRHSFISVFAMLMVVLSQVCGAEPTTSPSTRKVPAAPAPRKLGTAVQAKSQKYTKPTPEDLAIAEKWAAGRHAVLEAAIRPKLAKFETTHFVIYTDWDVREHGFLKDNFEAAYNAVSNQFGVPTSENIFIGKLPCYVTAKYSDFAAMIKALEGPAVNPDVQGMYFGYTRGLGLMVVHKPDEKLVAREHDLAVRFWKYVLTHEMTHAFVARYISDRPVTTWLNEGIAEVIASGRFAIDVRGQAKAAREKYRSLKPILTDDDKLRGADAYPVMRTLTEVLVRKDKKAFIQMFDDIKNGKSTEEALKDNYGWTYDQLEGRWTQYVVNDVWR